MMDAHTEESTHLQSARSEWEDGSARLERHTADSRRRQVLEDVVERLLDELEKRVGQSFSTEELAEHYRDAEEWATVVAHETAPDHPWAWDLSVVLPTAYFRFARRAQDYQP